MRKDLKMRRGKEIAQGSHASMAFLTRDAWLHDDIFENYKLSNYHETKEWMQNSFTKVCLYVNSEKELEEIYEKAKENGLTVHMVIDSGKTEFNGVPTKTCLCIGPHYSEKIDTITGHLKLL